MIEDSLFDEGISSTFLAISMWGMKVIGLLLLSTVLIHSKISIETEKLIIEKRHCSRKISL